MFLRLGIFKHFPPKKVLAGHNCHNPDYFLRTVSPCAISASLDSTWEGIDGAKRPTSWLAGDGADLGDRA
jgi:hypothetical protein